MKKHWDKALTLSRTAFKHELINGSFYIFLGFLISSFISFIFNLFLARTLSYSDYGEYSSLLSIFNLAIIPTTSLTAVVVRFATVYFTQNQDDKAEFLYRRMFIS